MTTIIRQDIESIFNAAVNAVQADEAIRSELSLVNGRSLAIGSHQIDIGPDGVYTIAIGKAAVALTDAAIGVIGDRFSAGIAVTKSEPSLSDERVTVLHGSHPVPDSKSLEAGAAILQFAADIPPGALVLCLLSGGGSSLVESLRDGVDLHRLRELTTTLLRSGASIHELNAVRSRLSRIKAGGLLQALAHTHVLNLIVSDVLGDDLYTIASGPTVPAGDADTDDVVRQYLLSGSLPAPEVRTATVVPLTIIAANLERAIQAATNQAVALGYRIVVLTQSLVGEAREIGSTFGAIMVDSVAGKSSFGPRTCILAGGETTVTVKGDGVGGRNTEASLAAAIRLTGVGGAALGFLATDGDDGTSNVAGAIVDGDTVPVEHRRAAVASLATNDSFTFLNERGVVVKTGPTGTNVNDLVIGLIE